MYKNVGNYVFVILLVFVCLFVSYVASIPSFHTSGTTSYITEDQSPVFEYNLSSNVTKNNLSTKSSTAQSSRLTSSNRFDPTNDAFSETKKLRAFAEQGVKVGLEAEGTVSRGGIFSAQTCENFVQTAESGGAGPLTWISVLIYAVGCGSP